jgi:DNA-binding NtrC family response regulator
MKGSEDMNLNSRAKALASVGISTPGISGPASTTAIIPVPGRILLVDDEIKLWWDQCLTELLRSGICVDIAEDGEAGLEAFQINDYDLLITDNKMPKLWGSELIVNLRSRGIMLPIILASTLLPILSPEQKPYFVNVHLLEKPVTPCQLSQTLHQIALTHRWFHQLPVPVCN